MDRRVDCEDDAEEPEAEHDHEERRDAGAQSDGNQDGYACEREG